MLVEEAQREVRSVYMNGVVGAVVSGTLWLAAAALGTWIGHYHAMFALVFGGMFIFPAMQLVLRLIG